MHLYRYIMKVSPLRTDNEVDLHKHKYSIISLLLSEPDQNTSSISTENIQTCSILADISQTNEGSNLEYLYTDLCNRLIKPIS